MRATALLILFLFVSSLSLATTVLGMWILTHNLGLRLALDSLVWASIGLNLAIGTVVRIARIGSE